MTTGATGVDVSVEFGFGSPPGAASPTWTDVSAFVDLQAAPLRISPGRTNDSPGLAPRSCAFTLDNRDGRFDPRNTSGPYYGDLVPRVPVRVRVAYSGTTRTLFRGFVDGGWPQNLIRRERYVEVSCLDFAGYAAQVDAPATAWDVAVETAVDNVRPDVWLRLTADGEYVDRYSGRRARLSGAVSEVEPLIAGDDKAYSPEYREASAVDVDVSLAPFVTFAAPAAGTPVVSPAALIGFWARLPTAIGDTGRVDLLDLRDSSGNLLLQIAAATHPTATDKRSLEILIRSNPWTTGNNGTTTIATFPESVPDLTNGARFFVLVRLTQVAFGSLGPWNPWLTVNGTGYLETTTSSSGGSALGQPARFSIGSDYQQRDRTTGPIDELVIWRDPNYNDNNNPSLLIGGVPGTVAVTLWTAGSVGRRGDTLDARLSWLVDAIGWDHVGTVDPSGIVIPDPYTGKTDTLSALRAIEDTEQGRVWIDNGGAVRFSSRSWAWTDTVSTTVQARFTDVGAAIDGGDLDYLPEQSVIVDDDRRLVNVAEVTRTGGRTQVVEDTASVAAYGRRSASLSDLMLPTDAQARSIAEWFIYNNAEPRPRVDRIAFAAGLRHSVTFPVASRIEPGWRVDVTHAGTTYPAHVVDVGHEIGFDDWRVDLILDGSRAGRTWFRWGTSTWGGSDGWAF